MYIYKVNLSFSIIITFLFLISLLSTKQIHKLLPIIITLIFQVANLFFMSLTFPGQFFFESLVGVGNFFGQMGNFSFKLNNSLG